MAVGVGDQGNREGINARVVSQWTIGEFRQFPVITFWQVLANLTDLIIDYVKIVDQPLSRRRDDVFPANRFGQRAVSGHQRA